MEARKHGINFVGIILLMQGAFTAYIYIISRILNYEKYFYNNNGKLIPGAFLEAYFVVLIISIMCYIGTSILKNYNNSTKFLRSTQFLLAIISIFYFIIIFSKISDALIVILILFSVLNILSIIIIYKSNIDLNDDKNTLITMSKNYKILFLFIINHIISVICIYNFFIFSKLLVLNVSICIIMSIFYIILKNTIYKNYNSQYLWVSFRPSVCISIIGVSLYMIYILKS